MKLRSIALAGVATAALCAPASASDYTGWYLGLGVGYQDPYLVHADSPATGPVKLAYNPDAFGIGAIGYKWDMNIRTELELGYGGNTTDQQTSAGTLSGAPKVRAMQIIDELEPVKRGGYGGAIGWASYTGDLDTCIHIRTVVVKDGVAYVQAGGGTVADAKPDYEYRESEAKARAVRQAVELAVRQPEWP